MPDGVTPGPGLVSCTVCKSTQLSKIPANISNMQTFQQLFWLLSRQWCHSFYVWMSTQNLWMHAHVVSIKQGKKTKSIRKQMSAIIYVLLLLFYETMYWGRTPKVFRVGCGRVLTGKLGFGKIWEIARKRQQRTQTKQNDKNIEKQESRSVCNKYRC